MRNAEKLIKTINEKLEKWNERSSFTIKGIKNLSLSDLEIILMYANEYIKSDGKNFGNLKLPLGSIKDVLKKYNIGITAKSITLE